MDLDLLKIRLPNMPHVNILLLRDMNARPIFGIQFNNATQFLARETALFQKHDRAQVLSEITLLAYVSRGRVS